MVTAAKDGRSKKRPGVAEQRAIIMDAAVALFADSGSSHVSIAQVCAAADVSRPTFYRCFPDKDALVAAIYDEAINVHVQDLLMHADVGDRPALQEEIGRMFDGIFARPQLARLVFAESKDPRSPAAQIVADTFEHSANTMSRALSRRGGKKLSRVYLKSLMAACQWIAEDAIDRGLTPTARREAREAAFLLVSRALDGE